MEIVRRAPDFDKLYPSKRSFDQAQAQVKSLSRSLKSGGLSPAIDGLRESADPDGITAESKSFNMRSYGHKMLRDSELSTVSSCEGRIANILFTVPSYDSDQPPYDRVISPRHERHFRRLISLMGGNRTYTILCHPNHIDPIRTWFAGLEGVRLDFAYSPRFDYTIWAQDAYVAVSDGAGQSSLVEGVCFPREDDMTIADDLSAQTPVSLIPSYLYFQGGNVLTSRDHVLIGMDYVWKNITRFGLADQAEVEHEFEEVFGRPVLSLGSELIADDDDFVYNLFKDQIFSGYGRQPLFHIDMFVTPTGIRNDAGREIVLMGRPSATLDVLGRYSEIDVADFPRIDACFDPIEAQLSAHYEVRHMPICLTRGRLGRPKGQERYYWLTFNNVVHEEDPDGAHHVYMTTYSEDADLFRTDRAVREALENAAALVYEGLGYTVHRMDGLEELAYGLGSVHCITKELARTA